MGSRSGKTDPCCERSECGLFDGKKGAWEGVLGCRGPLFGLGVGLVGVFALCKRLAECVHLTVSIPRSSVLLSLKETRECLWNHTPDLTTSPSTKAIPAWSPASHRRRRVRVPWALEFISWTFSAVLDYVFEGALQTSLCLPWRLAHAHRGGHTPQNCQNFRFSCAWPAVLLFIYLFAS